MLFLKTDFTDWLNVDTVTMQEWLMYPIIVKDRQFCQELAAISKSSPSVGGSIPNKILYSDT